METPQPVFFPSSKALREWFMRHHLKAEVLWVGFHKRETGVPSVTWPDSVDEALCFGWIDGVRKSVDAQRYMIRFTPRKKASHWSLVNVQKMKVLLEQGKVKPKGLEAWAMRDEAKTGRASHERAQPAVLEPFELKQFKANAKAWAWFEAAPAWMQRSSRHWVVSAKKTETRARRLAQLIEASEASQPIKPLRRPKRP